MIHHLFMWFGSYLYWEYTSEDRVIVNDNIIDSIDSNTDETNPLQEEDEIKEESEIDDTIIEGNGVVHLNENNCVETILPVISSNDISNIKNDHYLSISSSIPLVETIIPTNKGCMTINIPSCKVYVCHLKGRQYDNNQINKKLLDIQQSYICKHI